MRDGPTPSWWQNLHRKPATRPRWSITASRGQNAFSLRTEQSTAKHSSIAKHQMLPLLVLLILHLRERGGGMRWSFLNWNVLCGRSIGGARVRGRSTCGDGVLRGSCVLYSGMVTASRTQPWPDRQTARISHRLGAVMFLLEAGGLPSQHPIVHWARMRVLPAKGQRAVHGWLHHCAPWLRLSNVDMWCNVAMRPSPGLTQPRIRQGRLSQLRPDHHLSAARLPLGMRPNVMITETTFGDPRGLGHGSFAKMLGEMMPWILILFWTMHCQDCVGVYTMMAWMLEMHTIYLWQCVRRP